MLGMLRGTNGPPQRPTREDFNSRAVYRHVRNQALQHPGTILPWALSLLAFATVPFTGSIEALGAGFGLAVVGGIVWGWNYFARGETLAERRVQALIALRKEHDQVQIDQLQQDCEEAGFEIGAKETSEMLDGFRQLEEAIRQASHQTQDPEQAYYRAAAEDDLSRGSDLVHRALGLYKATSQIDVDTLRREVTKWRKDIGKLSNSRREALQSQIDAHERTIQLYEQSKDEEESLIAQVNDIGNTFVQAALTIPTLGLSAVMAQLQDGGKLKPAMQAAREVEDEARNSDRDAAARRQKYIDRDTSGTQEGQQA